MVRKNRMLRSPFFKSGNHAISANSARENHAHLELIKIPQPIYHSKQKNELSPKKI